MLPGADSRRGAVDGHHRRGDVDRPVVVGSWALQRKFTVFAAVLLVTGALALLPQDHTNAADAITIRALLSDDGDILIQRHYSSASRWVTVSAITLGQPEGGAVFQYGSTTLAIEFIPEARLPLPKDGGMTTRSVPSGEPAPPCEMEEVAWDDEGNPTRWEGECAGAPMAHLVTVSCEWGWGTSLGPYKGLGSALEAGLYALLICNHGRLLQGLPSVPGPISLDELQASVAAMLAAKGETRPLEAIPEEATQSNPIRSETTYVDIRVLKVAGSDGEPAISVQARGGGVQQPLRLGTAATVGIFSLVP